MRVLNFYPINSNSNWNESVLGRVYMMALKDETALSIGMISLALDILVGRFAF